MHGALLVVFSSAGCFDSEPSEPQLSTVVSPAYVTGAAAAALGPDGRFALEAPSSPNGDRIISPVQARRLAMGFLRSFGVAFRAGWEAERGGPIDLASLAASPRVYFAQTPYSAVPRNDVHSAHRRHFGPYYLVTLLQRSEPVLQISVSALTTEYSIDDRGRLVAPVETGMDFISDAMPADGSFRPISPEEAVAMAAEATGATIRDVPELVLMGSAHSPAFARWRIELDRPIRARGRDGRDAAAQRTVFVGSLRNSRFAVDDPDGSGSHRAVMVPRSGGGRPVAVQVNVRPGSHKALRAVDLSKTED